MFVEICKGISSMHNHRDKPGPSTSFGNNRSGQSLASDFRDDVDSQTSLMADSESQDTALNELIPYAHRDIKPANIMISNQGKPVLMDLGSCSRARIVLSNRQAALELQDLAAEHCTLPYRAPELFDVKTGSSVDERVDVWSLGCTLFCLMYSISPFEMQTAESGASLSMAIMSGKYKFPETPTYSDEVKDLVRMCLVTDPKERPFIGEVLDAARRILSEED